MGKDFYNTFYLEESYGYKFSYKRIYEIFGDSFYLEIIKSKPFQRLRKIHFLGAIDFSYPKKEMNEKRRNVKAYTRYDHSLGVAYLALIYAKYIGLNKDKERMCVASALLHDIGHAPFSHSFEPVLKRKSNGVTHHVMAEKLILGQIYSNPQINKILTKYSIDPLIVITNISGNGESPYREIFSYSINIDTIEGILRSKTYLDGETKGDVTPFQVLHAYLNFNDPFNESLLEYFWMQKNRVYAQLIQSNIGILSDFVCQEYMEAIQVDDWNEFVQDFYFSDDNRLAKDSSEIFSILNTLWSKGISTSYPNVSEIEFFEREFFFESNTYKSDLEDWPTANEPSGEGFKDSAKLFNEKFRQTKTKKALPIRRGHGRKKTKPTLFQSKEI